jgi:hypothetical protein
MPATTRRFCATALAFASAIMLACGVATPAKAQSLIATVNDSPITNYDLEQRVRLLRVLRQPATPAAALESIIEDRIKASETRKYGINPSAQDGTQEIARIAARAKIPAASLGPARRTFARASPTATADSNSLARCATSPSVRRSPVRSRRCQTALPTRLKRPRSAG